MKFINKVLCGTDSPLAKVAYALTVGARDCWCCTFYRGCIIAALPAYVVGYLLGRIG